MRFAVPLPPEVARSEAEKFFGKAYELGFTLISMHCSPGSGYLDVEWLRKVKGEYGLDLSFHSPTRNFDLSTPLEELRRLSVSYAVRIVKTGEAVEAVHYEFHLSGSYTSGFQPELLSSNASRSLKEILTLKPSGAVAVENDDHAYAFSRPESIRPILDDHPELKLILDVAHAYRSGVTPRRFVDEFSSRIYGVHLHDIVEGRDHFQVGLGSIPWPSLLKTVSRAKPQVVVLETYRGESRLLENAYRSLETVRRYLSPSNRR